MTVRDAAPTIDDMQRLTSFEEVEEALRSKDFVQAGKDRDSAPFTLHTLLSLSGAEHFARRRLESTLFRRRALADYEIGLVLPAIRMALDEARDRQSGA